MLQCVQIAKCFGESAPVSVLVSVSVIFKVGKITAITGVSGSGKSTLLHILGGLLTPSKGQVLIDDADLYREASSQRIDIRRRKIGFLFQNGYLLAHLTALENISVVSMLRGQRGRSGVDAAKQLLEQVGLDNRASHLPDQLSGGELQRVALARALAGAPSVILCDEPTGNLDPDTAMSIVKVLRDYASCNKTVVVVTHDPRVAELSDTRYRLINGILEKNIGAN